jgi:hypothetical protein
MKRQLFTIAAVACACAAVVCASAVHTAAASSGATVKLAWFTGTPNKGANGKYPSLNDASKGGDITYNVYTLKGKGRFQWGETTGEDGKYEVYYDADDLVALTEEVNRQTEQFNNVYEQYRQLINAIK